MSSMAEYNRHEMLTDLWRKIESLHLSYLEYEEGPEKLKTRRKLEGYISEYLTLVPYEFKFGLTETSAVLNKSIEELKEFNGYVACQGWEAIARYAANILAQPWRKEYRTIRTFCGYYKHEVESNLSCAHMMLEVMGYKNIGSGKLYLEGPICPDAVTAVSRDALIAYVYCQFLCADWEAARAHGSPRTWKQVAQNQQKASNTYDESKHLYSNINPRQEQQIANYNHTYEHSSPIRINNRHQIPRQRYNTTPSHSRLVNEQYNHRTIPDTYINDVNYSYNNQPYSQYVYGMPPQISNCYVPDGYYNGGASSVPTAQLIDYSERSSFRTNGLPRSDTQPALISAARDEGAGTYESWDYVFRNLEAQERNCSTKTLDRCRERSFERFQPMTMDLEDGLRAMSLDKTQEEELNRMARVNETLMKLKQSEMRKKQRKIEEERRIEEARKLEDSQRLEMEELRKQKRAMIEEARLLEEGRREMEERRKAEEKRKLAERKLEEVRKKKLDESRTMPKQNGLHKTLVDLGQDLSVTKSDSTKNGQAVPNGTEPPQRVLSIDVVDSSSCKTSKSSSKWNCGACTYLNGPALKVCAMCGKSRDWASSNAKEGSLESGGRECPACTLVNARRAQTCAACNANLAHSPTYI